MPQTQTNGKYTDTVVPAPNSDSIVMIPLFSSMLFLMVSRPNWGTFAYSTLIDFGVGAYIFNISSLEIPSPLSLMIVLKYFHAASCSINISPPRLLNLIALSSRPANDRRSEEHTSELQS